MYLKKNRAASFNIDIVKNVARITAEETRAVGNIISHNPNKKLVQKDKKKVAKIHKKLFPYSIKILL